MAIILHHPSIEESTREFAEFSEAQLVGQQMVMRGAIDALEFLVAHREHGTTAEAMLDSLRAQLIALHEAAHARGLTLMGYS